MKLLKALASASDQVGMERNTPECKRCKAQVEMGLPQNSFIRYFTFGCLEHLMKGANVA